ncbi:hypothetical protein HY385_01695 [Candidatus Daviesbacteria bacterium]|nr:hypothetical protein [Candidatus Daviesbacteria bacterium]
MAFSEIIRYEYDGNCCESVGLTNSVFIALARHLNNPRTLVIRRYDQSLPWKSRVEFNKEADYISINSRFIDQGMQDRQRKSLWPNSEYQKQFRRELVKEIRWKIWEWAFRSVLQLEGGNIPSRLLSLLPKIPQELGLTLFWLRYKDMAVLNLAEIKPRGGRFPV